MALNSISSPAVLVLNKTDVFIVILCLVGVALFLVLQPLILSRGSIFKKSENTLRFFEIPFITWFLIHYGLAALAVIAIVILALDGVIDKSTVAALLGSLFGYVLGSSSKGVPPHNSSQDRPSVTKTT